MLLCQHPSKGFKTYQCPKCGNIRTIHFNCNGRLCTNCGKRHTDRWAEKVQQRLADVSHRHVVFTMPDELWKIIETRKELLNVAFHSIFLTIRDVFYHQCNKKHHVLPGILAVLHTYGEDLKFNVHFHCVITEGGLNDANDWINIPYILYESLRKSWQYHLLTSIRKELPETNENRKVIDRMFTHYLDGFYVRAKDRTPRDKQDLLRYIARYIRHPAIAQSRINSFDKGIVSFDCEKDTRGKYTVAMPVQEFILAIIKHIPEKGFRLVRYMGMYSNSKRKNSLAILSRFRAIVVSLQKKLVGTQVFCDICGCEMEEMHIQAPTDPPPYLDIRNLIHGNDLIPFIEPDVQSS